MISRIVFLNNIKGNEVIQRSHVCHCHRFILFLSRNIDRHFYNRQVNGTENLPSWFTEILVESSLLSSLYARNDQTIQIASRCSIWHKYDYILSPDIFNNKSSNGPGVQHTVANIGFPAIHREVMRF